MLDTNVLISPTTTTALFSGIEPNSPEYPSELSTQLAAGAEIASVLLDLTHNPVFPGGVLSVSYNSTVPALNFSTFDELLSLSVNGSIFAGQHIRTSGNVGIVQGKLVAQEVYGQALEHI